jgi:hypothetical protein
MVRHPAKQIIRLHLTSLSLIVCFFLSILLRDGFSLFFVLLALLLQTELTVLPALAE